MPDLRDDLRAALEGARLVGVGNPDLGDDGFGVRLAEALLEAGLPDVIVAGTSPESVLDEIAAEGRRNVVFLDAAEFPGEPGSAVLLDGAAVKARFPQVSTHKISLGTLARVIEDRSGARTWLLGVKPVSLRPGARLSSAVAGTLEILRDLILEARPGGPAERACIA
jgi:hydrogenase maturation protease